jgi:hypothetical protein
MKKRAKARRTRRMHGGQSGAVICNHKFPRYNLGDRLRVDLSSETVDSGVSVWICVDHCDDDHEIVFGTIDSDLSQQFGKALRRGAKLAAIYRQVRERQPAA